MAKVKKEKETKEVLKELIKSRAPALFEREPAPAFKEGNLSSLLDEIINIFG